ncbi:MAG: AraC family transcriptional regulator ligand-binding domain-containing protein [Panacagrimonas sp.]
MQSSTLLVPTRYYARLAEVLAGDGIDFAALLRKLRLSPTLLTDPEAMIRVSQFDRLVEGVYAAARRSDIGYELGKLLSATSHSFVGFGMLNSETLDQALRFEAQYFRLVMPSFRMRYTSGPDYGEMAFTPTVAMGHLALAFHIETIGTAAHREVMDLTAPHRPACRLELSIPEPPHARRYQRELKNVEVRFAADVTPGIKLRILEDPRALRLAMADSNARRMAEARCRAMVKQVANDRRFSDWIAMTLREVADELPTLEQLAATLNMTSRTLRRYLAREGTTFRELAGKIEQELAVARLEAGAMSVSEVAYSLGYADRSNFGRAVRSRAGYSPGQHRVARSGQRTPRR